MTESWQDFLKGYNVTLDPVYGSRFNEPAREIHLASLGDILIDLSHLGVVVVQGEEAPAFLLNQLTNDLNRVDETHGQLSAYCTPKGRMLALFRIFKRDDDFLLVAPESILEPAVARLRMYVLRSRVTLNPDNRFICIGLSGPGADSALTRLFGDTAKHIHGVFRGESLSIMRLSGPHPRFLLVGESESIKRTWQRLAESIPPVGRAAWSWLDIMAGQPSILPETTEAFVPQMANLDVIDGVSFNKGCYPGQEIVARMQYLGKLKQRMYRAHAVTDAKPVAGDHLYAPAFREQSAGTVVDAQISPTGGFDLLAVIQTRAVDEGELHLGNIDGPTLVIADLPYQLPAVKET